MKKKIVTVFIAILTCLCCSVAVAAETPEYSPVVTADTTGGGPVVTDETSEDVSSATDEISDDYIANTEVTLVPDETSDEKNADTGVVHPELALGIMMGCACIAYAMYRKSH